MKITTTEAVVAYRLLGEVKLDKMENAEQIWVVRLMRALKGVATDFDDFLKDAVKRLRPEGHDAVEAILREPQGHTPEEIAGARKAQAAYNEQVAECVGPEESKEHDLDIAPIGDEALGRFIASNSLPLSQIMAVEPLFCGKDAKE